MFGLSKKLGQSRGDDGMIDNTSNDENMFENEEPSLLEKEPNVLKENNQEWNSNLNWADSRISWSRVMISQTEEYSQYGISHRVKDTPLVVLVRRLEEFPHKNTIKQIRDNLDKHINRLKSVQAAMNYQEAGEESEESTHNPILTEAGAQLASELKKVAIESQMFNQKITGEVDTINELVNAITATGKSHKLVLAVLELYDFFEDKYNTIYHISTPTEAALQDMEKKYLVHNESIKNDQQDQNNRENIENQDVNKDKDNLSKKENKQDNTAIVSQNAPIVIDEQSTANISKTNNKAIVQNENYSILEEDNPNTLNYIFGTTSNVKADEINASNKLPKLKQIKIKTSENSDY
jgi:hypothetical protein